MPACLRGSLGKAPKAVLRYSVPATIIHTFLDTEEDLLIGDEYPMIYGVNIKQAAEVVEKQLERRGDLLKLVREVTFGKTDNLRYMCQKILAVKGKTVDLDKLAKSNRIFRSETFKGIRAARVAVKHLTGKIGGETRTAKEAKLGSNNVLVRLYLKPDPKDEATMPILLVNLEDLGVDIHQYEQSYYETKDHDTSTVSASVDFCNEPLRKKRKLKENSFQLETNWGRKHLMKCPTKW